MDYYHKHLFDFELEKTIDERTVLIKKLGPALAKGVKKSIEIDIKNTDRSLGTIFGAEITKRYFNRLEDDTYIVKCNGSGGQSFEHLFQRGSRWSLQAIQTITSARACPAERL